MHDVKSYDFVKDYFRNPKTLLNVIVEYQRITKISKGEYCLLDLLK